MLDSMFYVVKKVIVLMVVKLVKVVYSMVVEILRMFSMVSSVVK